MLFADPVLFTIGAMLLAAAKALNLYGVDIALSPW